MDTGHPATSKAGAQMGSEGIWSGGIAADRSIGIV